MKARGLLGAAGLRGLAFVMMLALALGLAGCGKPDAVPAANPKSGAATGVAATASGVLRILAGSELRDLEPALLQAAQQAGVVVNLSYAGALDIVERVNEGERFDAILPPNGAYPALAMNSAPLAREKLFYSRVALGVKAGVARSLGWDRHNPSWADIAKAAGQGRLRYAMTNPVSSNTGMSALFAVASAVAGKTEDLSAQEVDGPLLTAFLSGQKLQAGSSGWLADAFVKEAAGLDAMVNYEAVILRTNERLSAADQLRLIYPQDGVISADYPLMLLNDARREDFGRLVAAWKAPAVQRELAQHFFLRPSVADVPLSAQLPATPVVELSFPNRLEVIDAVLASCQSQWRRPATSIFVLDTSGSMRGDRLRAMQDALKVLAGVDARVASARYARFQNREHVVLLGFSDRLASPVSVNFETQDQAQARQQILGYADDLQAQGGTAIFAALLKAQALAQAEKAQFPDRLVSIVLLTDGENNVRPTLEQFQENLNAAGITRVFPILFGEANPADMNTLAQFTGGRVFDGRKTALSQVFKEIRGYQ